MRFISIFGLLLSVLIACPSAFGDDRAAAKKAFKTGVEHFNNNRYDEAAGAFRKANELHPSWKIVYNIGQCEMALKRYGLAIEAFEYYLGEGGDDVPTARRDEVISELERLRAMVGVVKINGPYNLDIYVDGIHRGKTPISAGILVSAGVPHEFRIMDGEMEWLVQTETARGGIALAIDVPASPRSAAVATAVTKKEVKEENSATEESPEEDSAIGESPEEDSATEESPDGEDGASGLKIGGWISVGVGAGALVGGVVSLVMAKKADDDRIKIAKETGVLSASKEEKRDNLNLAGGVLLGVGGAIAVTGAVLLIVDAVKGKKEESKEVDVSLLPCAGPEFSGVMLRGTF